eukprot:361278-Chlamydomonas_euryale.AAC.10
MGHAPAWPANRRNGPSLPTGGTQPHVQLPRSDYPPPPLHAPCFPVYAGLLTPGHQIRLPQPRTCHASAPAPPPFPYRTQPLCFPLTNPPVD